jgi:hypothetical protein
MSGLVIEGHAIVSADGMIAAADGSMPPQLRNDADWAAFQAALDASALVVVGRVGHRRHPNPGRRRLVVTRSVGGIAPDSADPAAVFWNPAGTTLADALDHLGITAGTIAITGGTGVFDLFATRFHRFTLTEVHGFVLPGGTPCFSSGHPRSVLAASGLVPGARQSLDVTGVTATRWERRH